MTKSHFRILAATLLAIVSLVMPAMASTGAQTVIEDPVILNEDAAKLSLTEVTTQFNQNLGTEATHMERSQLHYSTCRQKAVKQGLSDSDPQRTACEVDAAYRNIRHYENLEAITATAAADFYGQSEKLKFTIQDQRDARTSHGKEIKDLHDSLEAHKAKFAPIYAQIVPGQETLEQKRALLDFSDQVERVQQAVRAQKEEIRKLDHLVAFNEGMVGRLEEWGFSMESTSRKFGRYVSDEEYIIQRIDNGAEIAALTDESDGLPAIFEGLSKTLSKIDSFIQEDRALPEDQNKAATAAQPAEIAAPPVTDLYKQVGDLLSIEISEVTQ